MSENIRLRVADLIAAAAEVSRIPQVVLCGLGRSKPFVRVRFAIYWLGKQHGLGIAHTGRCLNRDHTTVMHGIERANYMRERDTDFAALVNAIEAKARMIAAERRDDILRLTGLAA